MRLNEEWLDTINIQWSDNEEVREEQVIEMDDWLKGHEPHTSIHPIVHQSLWADAKKRYSQGDLILLEIEDRDNKENIVHLILGWDDIHLWFNTLSPLGRDRLSLRELCVYRHSLISNP